MNTADNTVIDLALIEVSAVDVEENSKAGKFVSYSACVAAFIIGLHQGIAIVAAAYALLFTFLAGLIGSVFAVIVTFIVGLATVYLAGNLVVAAATLLASGAFIATNWITTKVSTSVKRIKGFFIRKK